MPAISIAMRDVPLRRAQEAHGGDAASSSSGSRAGRRGEEWRARCRGAGVRRRGVGRGRREPVAGQRAVRVDRVRHDRRAEDGCRQQHRSGALEARNQPADDAAGVGRGEEHAEREADRDDREQPDHHELERPRAPPGLHQQQDDRDRSGDDAAPQQRDAEEQVQRDGSADDLGDVGRHRDELGLQPVRASRPRAADAAAEHLGQALARDDAELRREVLDQPGHDVAEHDDPHQQVAERAPAVMLLATLPGSRYATPATSAGPSSHATAVAVRARPAARGGRRRRAAVFGTPKL